MPESVFTPPLPLHGCARFTAHCRRVAQSSRPITLGRLWCANGNALTSSDVATFVSELDALAERPVLALLWIAMGSSISRNATLIL